MATVTYEAGLARVKLVTNVLGAGKTGFQVSRFDVGTGRSTLVRGGRNVLTTVGSAVTLFDYEFPAGGTVQYFAAEVAGTAVGSPASMAAAAAYDPDAVWIKHTTRPYLNRVMQVVDYEPVTQEMRPGLIAVLRRPVPVGRGDVRAGRSYSLTVRTATVAELAELDTLVGVGGVLFVHLPAGTPGLPRVPYVVVTGSAEARAGARRGDVRRTVLSVAEAAAPAPDLIGSAITYAGLPGEWATYAALAADPAAPTYAALAALALAPSEVLIP